jgi:tripartite-type tricarboxylate transporter receptor subunit TctC
MLGQVTPVMVVSAASPVHSVQELIALAKAKPGEINYGSFGNGSYAHVAMEDFKQRTGTQMMHIPYRGAAPAYTALIRNETTVMVANLSGAMNQAEAGNVRIIAAAGPHRSKARPDLPTVAESGVPGFSTGAWWGMFGPANLPRPVVEKIRTELSRILATPEMQKIFATNTMEREDMTQEQFVQFIRDDLANWARQIKAAGIKPD